MPNRIVRDGILTSQRVNLLSSEAELFYRRLMSVVDDFGRYHANPTLLRAACYPLKIDSVTDKDVEKWLSDCTTARLIIIYTIAGKHCIELLDFRQQVRAKKSKFPAPDEHMRSVCVADASQVIANAHLDGDVDGDVDVDVDVSEVECGDGAKGNEPVLRFTLADCKNAAEGLAMPPKQVEDFFTHYAAVNFEDGCGRTIVSLKHSLAKWKANQGKRDEKKTDTGLINTWHSNNPDKAMRKAF